MTIRLWLVSVVLSSAPLSLAAEEAPYWAFDGFGRQFFQNSTRRDATAQEADHVVNARGCAAFFVANRSGKTLLGSARHCFNYSITNWCQGGGMVTDNQGRTGTCQRIVAADANHDIAVFEAKFPYVPEEQDTLRLAAYQPKLQDRLVMIGYPADKYRLGRLTTTEDCWVIRESVPSPHSQAALSDRSSLHNCTTYGGNSGGPMMLEGTRVVLGLPFTYAPDDYHLRDPWDPATAAHLAQMADFVSFHRAKLEAEGVEIVD